MRVKLILLSIIALITASCNVINPDESIPSYILIEDYDLQTNFSLEGSDSERITEMWVFAGGKYVGAYDLPAEIPVIGSGNVEIDIFPGIRNNGISSTRIIYPFYKAYTTTVNLQAETDAVISPAFEYKEDLVFWMENFDDPGIKFNALASSDTSIYRTTENSLVFEGSGSGEIHLDGNNDYLLIATQEDIDLPAGRQIFCELDYRSENSFVVGIQANQAGSISRAPALVVLPSREGSDEAIWNKIYIELSYVAGDFINADSYQLYIESVLDGNNSEASIYLDNLKVVYFD